MGNGFNQFLDALGFGDNTDTSGDKKVDDSANDVADVQDDKTSVDNQDTDVIDNTPDDVNDFADDPRYSDYFAGDTKDDDKSTDVDDATGVDDINKSTDADDKDPKDALIQQLTDQNAQIMQLLNDQKNPIEKEVEPEKPTDVFATDEFKTMTDAMNMDDSDVVLFKNFMKTFAEQNNKVVLKQAMEDTPNLVNSAVNKQTKFQEVAKNFYSANPALAEIQPYVKEVATSIASQYPNASLVDVLKTTADRVYKTLNIKPPVKGERTTKDDQPTKAKVKPAFATNVAARRNPVKQSKTQIELSAMMTDAF